MRSELLLAGSGVAGDASVAGGASMGCVDALVAGAEGLQAAITSPKVAAANVI